MLKIGVQTQNVIKDQNPSAGFKMIRDAGFNCVDFSLHDYLLNLDIYQGKRNNFFDKSIFELEKYFQPHKSAAQSFNIKIHQMHMPYPMFDPRGEESLNEYLFNEVAPKSLHVCKFFDCKYIVLHGFKISKYVGSEENEWIYTEKFIERFAPLIKELNITLCIENLYENIGGHLVETTGGNAKKAVERIDRINDKYKSEILGFCFDTGHANLIGLDFEKFITTLDYRLKILHIHDNDGIRDLHQIPFTFSRARESNSSTDWQGFINGLRNIHFDKVLNFETSPILNSFPSELHFEALKFIASIGNYFKHKIDN